MAHERPQATPAACSPPHAASLATTSGITAVITAAGAASALAMPRPPGASGWAALGASVLWVAASGCLWAARDATGHALDASAPGRWGASALRRYHLGMAGLYAGLALTALARWPGAGWAPAAVALGLAGAAVARAASIENRAGL